MSDNLDARRPNSLEARDIESLFHPQTNLQLHAEKGPTIFMRGKGIYVYDERGKEYIEGMAGLWCTALGYGVEELVEAGTEQLRKLAFSHLFASKSHEPAIELAEKLIEVSPFDRGKVFFGNSGSDANDTQMKLMRYYNNAIGRPERKKIIARHRAYHGVTLASASLTGLPVMHKLFDLPMEGVLHTHAAYYYRDRQDGEDEPAYVERLAGDLEQMIEREGPQTIAAMIAEPVMGAGGLLVPPEGYFPRIQQVLRKYDIPLISDEVICGFGRTGNYWGAQSVGMEPVSISAAKALTSAYLPLSAVIVQNDLYDEVQRASGEIGSFGHGYTYSGHPVCCAVSLRALELYEQWDVWGQVARNTPIFQRCLQSLSDHPLVGDARGIGLMGAVELVADKESRRAFDPKAGVGMKCENAAQEHGLITRFLGDTVVVCPPLIIESAEIEEMFRRFRLGLDTALEEVHKLGLI